jgi:hypothetical protein
MHVFEYRSIPQIMAMVKEQMMLNFWMEWGNHGQPIFRQTQYIYMHMYIRVYIYVYTYIYIYVYI